MTSEFSIAIHCLVYLSHNGGGHTSERIAESVCTNPTRIRKILAKLKKHGLVATREGVSGGYFLRSPASETSLAEILDAVEEEPVSVSWRPGGLDMPCRIASGMAAVMDRLYIELNDACRQRLKARTLAEIEEKLFLENGEK